MKKGKSSCVIEIENERKAQKLIGIKLEPKFPLALGVRKSSKLDECFWPKLSLLSKFLPRGGCACRLTKKNYFLTKKYMPGWLKTLKITIPSLSIFPWFSLPKRKVSSASLLNFWAKNLQKLVFFSLYLVPYGKSVKKKKFLVVSQESCVVVRSRLIDIERKAVSGLVDYLRWQTIRWWHRGEISDLFIYWITLVT